MYTLICLILSHNNSLNEELLPHFTDEVTKVCRGHNGKEGLVKGGESMQNITLNLTIYIVVSKNSTLNWQESQKNSLKLQLFGPTSREPHSIGLK